MNRDGDTCAVAFTGADRGSQWPGSRVISVQKANTANAFSLPALSLSTANLYSAVQPGGSRFQEGLKFGGRQGAPNLLGLNGEIPIKKPRNRCSLVFCAYERDGGPDRDRTDDLHNAIVALSQLSYEPVCSHKRGRRGT